MKRASRGKKKSSGALSVLLWLLLMAAAVALGLFLPTVVTGVQSRRADSTKEYVDLGSSVLSLTSDSAKLEKLGLPNALYSTSDREYSFFAISNGKYMTAGDAIDMMYEIPRLIDGTGLPYTQFGRENVEYAGPELLISDESDLTTAILWVVNAVVQNEDGYCALNYAVDDATGLIVAAEFYQIKNEEEYGTFAEDNPSNKTDYSDTVRRIASNIEKIYKFTNTTAELDNSVNVGDNYRYSISFYTCGQRAMTVPVCVGETEWRINIP